MRSTMLLAALAALLMAQSAHAQNATAKGETVLQALKRMGATRYIELLDASKSTDAIGNLPAATTTVLAASNEAVDDYLSENHMTMDDVKQREALADRIVGYTVIIDGNKDVIGALKKGESKFLPTYNVDWAIETKRGDGGELTFTDAGGDSVTINDGDAKAREAGRVFVVDELLLPGNIFERFNDFRFDVLLPNNTRHEQELFETFKALVRRAGVTREHVHNLTVFVPFDPAFRAIGLTPDAVEQLEPGQAYDLILYHSVRGFEPIPRPKADQPMPTLLQLGGKNQTIKLEYSVNKTDKGAVGTAFVVDQLGNKAEVIAPNFFAGTMTVHAIDKVLQPAKDFLPATLTAALKKPADKKQGSRKLLFFPAAWR